MLEYGIQVLQQTLDWSGRCMCSATRLVFRRRTVKSKTMGNQIWSVEYQLGNARTPMIKVMDWKSGHVIRDTRR